LRNYFLKGYSLILAVTLPITIASAVLADDLIQVLLGPKWKDAAQIFRLLAPTILVFGLINPLGWFLFSLGMVGRSLRIALVLAPIVVMAYVIGLAHGPNGVALAYSVAMSLWVIPHIAWCVHGTIISLKDVLKSASRPFLSGLVAAVVTLVVQNLAGPISSAFLRLCLAGTAMLASYVWMLLYVMGQGNIFYGLARELTKIPASEKVAVEV
jgi:PST family polysaccharide transporter